MSDFFSLVEHRKSIQGRVIRLSGELAVIAMDQSNDDELANQLRQLEARKLAREVNEQLEQAETASNEGRDEDAARLVTAATKASQAGLKLMLDTIRTLVCTEDGTKVTVAQLKSCIGSQDEAAVVMDAIAAARVVDPPKPTPAGSTPT